MNLDPGLATGLNFGLILLPRFELREKHISYFVLEPRERTYLLHLALILILALSLNLNLDLKPLHPILKTRNCQSVAVESETGDEALAVFSEQKVLTIIFAIKDIGNMNFNDRRINSCYTV